MSKQNTKLAILAVVVVLLQLLIFNNILLFQSFNPYVYVLIFLIYPTKFNQNYLLILAFLVGVIIDYFSATGGLHAFSSVLLAFIRLPLIRFISGKRNLDLSDFDFADFNLFQKFLYVVISVFIHHGVLFLVENFKLGAFYELGINLLFSVATTSILLFIYFGLTFRNRIIV